MSLSCKYNTEPTNLEISRLLPSCRGERRLPGVPYQLKRQTLVIASLSWRKGKPRIVELYSPTKEFLRIGIGGAFAGLAVINLPSIRILVNPGSIARGPISFDIQGQPSTLQG